MYSYKLSSLDTTQPEHEPLVLAPGSIIFSLLPYKGKPKAVHVMIYTPEEGSINDISHAIIGDNPGVTLHSLAFLLKKMGSTEFFIVNPTSAELGLLAARQARTWAMTGTKIDYRKLNMMTRYSTDRDEKKKEVDELAIAQASPEEAVFHTLKRVTRTEQAPVRMKDDRALERGLTCPELVIDAFNAIALDTELKQRGISVDKNRSYSNKYADLDGEYKNAVDETTGYAEYVKSLRTRPKVLAKPEPTDMHTYKEETPHRHLETGSLQPCHTTPTIAILPTELRKNIKPLYNVLPFKLCPKRTTPEALMLDVMHSPHFKVLGKVQIVATALNPDLNSKDQYQKERSARSRFVNHLRLQTLDSKFQAMQRELSELKKLREIRVKINTALSKSKEDELKIDESDIQFLSTKDSSSFNRFLLLSIGHKPQIALQLSKHYTPSPENKISDRNTLLIYASSSHQLELVKVFLAKGAGHLMINNRRELDLALSSSINISSDFVDLRTAFTLLEAGAQFSFDDIAKLRHIQLGYSNETADQRKAREDVLAKFKVWARTLGSEELSRLDSKDRLNLERVLSGKDDLYLSPHSFWDKTSDAGLDHQSEVTAKSADEPKEDKRSSSTLTRGGTSA